MALASICGAVRAGAVDAPAGAAAVAPPLAWQEPAPLARLFLQLPFEAPETLAARRLALELRLLYANSLLVAENERFTLDVHVEAAQPTLFLRRGIARGVEAQLAVPFVVDSGGFLDRPIELAERLFHASNPQRRGRPRNVARFELARRGGGEVSRDGPGAGVGDVWAGLKVSVANLGRGALSVRGALKLPTGRLPYGSEELDLGASVLAGFRWTASAVRLQLDLGVPTARLPEVNVTTRPWARRTWAGRWASGNAWRSRSRRAAISRRSPAPASARSTARRLTCSGERRSRSPAASSCRRGSRRMSSARTAGPTSRSSSGYGRGREARRGVAVRSA